ncbi:hypothetical protein RHS02_06988, partial [Rhizoctonia solani]
MRFLQPGPSDHQPLTVEHSGTVIATHIKPDQNGHVLPDVPQPPNSVGMMIDETGISRFASFSSPSNLVEVGSPGTLVYETCRWIAAVETERFSNYILLRDSFRDLANEFISRNLVVSPQTIPASQRGIAPEPVLWHVQGEFGMSYNLEFRDGIPTRIYTYTASADAPPPSRRINSLTLYGGKSYTVLLRFFVIEDAYHGWHCVAAINLEPLWVYPIWPPVEVSDTAGFREMCISLRYPAIADSVATFQPLPPLQMNTSLFGGEVLESTLPPAPEHAYAFDLGLSPFRYLETAIESPGLVVDSSITLPVNHTSTSTYADSSAVASCSRSVTSRPSNRNRSRPVAPRLRKLAPAPAPARD